jgi:hypothetical protein
MEIVLTSTQTEPRWVGDRFQGVGPERMMVLQRSSPHANGVFGKTRLPGLLTTGMRRVTGRIVQRMRVIASDKSSLQRGATIYLGKMVMGVVAGLGGWINHPDSGSEIATAIVTDHAGLVHAQNHRIDIGEDDLDHEVLNDLINEDDDIERLYYT